MLPRLLPRLTPPNILNLELLWRMGVALSGAELRFAVDLKAFSGMVPSAVEPKQ